MIRFILIKTCVIFPLLLNSCKIGASKEDTTGVQSVGSLYQGGNPLDKPERFPSFKALSLLYLDFGMCPSQGGIGPSADNLSRMVAKIPQDYLNEVMETIKGNVFNYEEYLDEQVSYLYLILTASEQQDLPRLKRLLEEDADQMLHMIGILSNVDHFKTVEPIKNDELAFAIERIRKGNIQLRFFDGILLNIAGWFSSGARGANEKIQKAIKDAADTTNRMLPECFSPHLAHLKSKITTQKTQLAEERDAIVNAQLLFAKSPAFRQANRAAYRDLMYTISVLKKVKGYKMYGGKFDKVNTEANGLTCEAGSAGGFVGFWLDFMVNSYGGTKSAESKATEKIPNKSLDVTLSRPEKELWVASKKSRDDMTKCLKKYSGSYGGFL